MATFTARKTYAIQEEKSIKEEKREVLKLN